MSFSKGATVKIGSGKTVWTVVGNNGAGELNLVSAKGAKRSVHFSDVTLVQAATPVVKFSAKPAKLVKGKRGGKLRTVR